MLNRLAEALDNKKITHPTKKITSTFDCSKETLTPETVITDSYKNGTNARIFFRNHCGLQFAFSIPFINWMKANNGNKLKML